MINDSNSHWRRKVENGTAIIDDDYIGVRVVCNSNGDCHAKSIIPRLESMMRHSEVIDAMVSEAQSMLKPTD